MKKTTFSLHWSVQSTWRRRACRKASSPSVSDANSAQDHLCLASCSQHRCCLQLQPARCSPLLHQLHHPPILPLEHTVETERLHPKTLGDAVLGAFCSPARAASHWVCSHVARDSLGLLADWHRPSLAQPPFHRESAPPAQAILPPGQGRPSVTDNLAD